MKTVTTKLTFILAVILLLPQFALSQLQWKKVHSFGSRISVVYFYNENIGFVALGTVPGSNITSISQIYRTLDGGKTWTLTQSPYIKGYGINDIIMEDELHGWAGGDDQCGRVWHTSDGGSSWEVFSSPTGGSLINSIRKTSQGMLVTDFSRGTIELSTDSCRTFHEVYRSSPWDNILGMDFVDSVHGAAVTQFRDRENRWQYTSDGGLSWHSSNYGTEAWTLKSIKGTSTFYAIPEGYSDIDGYLSEVMRSSDFGRTWNKIATLPFRGTSDVEIVDSVLYVQTGPNECENCTFPDGIGIYRSTDSGMTWHGMGGPGYWGDTRFAVTVSCAGTTIYCADNSYDLYKGFDTLITKAMPLDAPLHVHSEPPDSLSLSACGYANTRAVIGIDECYKLVILSEIIEGLDSPFFTLNPTKLPLVLRGLSDSVRIDFHTGSDARRYNAVLHLKGYYDYGFRGRIPFDTSFALVANVTAQPKLTADMGTALFRIVNPCSSLRDTTVTFMNLGCVPLTVVSGPGDLGANFYYDPIQLPITLAHGGSFSVRFHFIPDSLITYYSSASFAFVSDTNQGMLSVALKGEIEWSLPKLGSSNSALQFPGISLCDPSLDSTLIVSNTGCDTLRIVNVIRPLSNDFVIDSIVLPFTLAPGQSFPIKIGYHPHVLGRSTGKLTVLAKGRDTTTELKISIVADAVAKPPRIDVSASTIDFGTLSTCESRKDTTLAITNMGCDTMQIVSAPLSMPGEFTMDPLSLPFTLAPGATVLVHFHFHPSGPGSFVTSPEFIAERFGAKLTIPLYLIGSGTQGTGILQTTPDVFSFKPMLLCSSGDSLDGVIKNTGCDSLILDAAVLTEDPDISAELPSFPFALASGDSIHYKVFCMPNAKENIKATLAITAHSAHGGAGPYLAIMPIQGSVSDGSRMLTVSPESIDFGKTNLCSAPEGIITVSNGGCDTLRVERADVIGKGFSVAGQFPVTIVPGGSAALKISTELDTSSGNTSSDAEVIFISNSDIPPKFVSLHREYVYPKQYSLSLRASRASGTAGDTAIFELTSDAPLAGIKTIDCNIAFDNDLLAFSGYEGANSVRLENGHLSISGYPFIVEDQDVIATLKFTTFLSKEASTDLLLSATHLNSTDPAFEECTARAQASGNSFTYIYGCGDNTLAHYLASGSPIVITSIRPNPVAGVLKVDVLTERDGDVRVTVTDLIGNTRIVKTAFLKKGDSSIPIDASSLPSGIYSLRLSGSSFERTGRFIKER
jgi:photosystem II stability/assembly factor-like uncharacterized protein